MLCFQTGVGKRAVNTMNNHSEQFGFFAAAVIVNLIFHPGSLLVAVTSLVHAGFRVFHVVFYLGDAATLRSLAFTGSAVCHFVLFIHALTALS